MDFPHIFPFYLGNYLSLSNIKPQPLYKSNGYQPGLNMPYERLFNSGYKARGIWKMKKRESTPVMKLTPKPSKKKKTAILGSNKVTPAEENLQEVLCSEEIGVACADSSEKNNETYLELCNVMNNALHGESPSLEEMHRASQVIVLGQKFLRVGQQEEWSPQNWFTKFTQIVEQAVIKIPQPPLDRLGSGHSEKVLGEYLQMVQVTVLEELRKFTPVLRETPLLGCVVECFHQCIFAQLDQVLQCTLTAEETYQVLYWVTHVYLSDVLMGHPDIQDDCFKAVDLLVLSDWLQRAEKTLLSAVQEAVSARLHSILQNEKIYWGGYILGDEEDFIKLHLDVIQVFHGCIEPAGMVSKKLKLKVQELCYPKLLVFMEKYVEKEKKQLKMHAKSDEKYPFRTLSTSMEFRKYVQTIASNRNGDSIRTVRLLKNIEAQSLELVLRKPLSKAKGALKEYLKKGDGQKMSLIIEEIRERFTALPKTNQDAHKIAVDTAYDRFTSLYLKDLLQSNKSELERAWIDVGSKVKEDAEYVHKMFSQLNPGVMQRNQALLNVERILKCNDLNALKITVAEMRIDCPDISQEEVCSQLRWKGLSRNQVNEVLEAGLEYLCNIHPLSNKQRCYHCCCWC